MGTYLSVSVSPEHTVASSKQSCLTTIEITLRLLLRTWICLCAVSGHVTVSPANTVTVQCTRIYDYSTPWKLTAILKWQ